MDKHEMYGGKLLLFKRPRSPFWQGRTFIGGQQQRISTKTANLQEAEQIAEDWFLGLKGKAKAGIPIHEKTFSEAADRFMKEYEEITEGQRSPKWVKGHEIRLRLHLIPFFGKLTMSQVTTGKVQEYRAHRMTSSRKENPSTSRSKNPPKLKAPARKTIHNEIVTLSLVLKTALRHEWLKIMPDLSHPYLTQGKLEHRPWFSPEEYRELYKATRTNARRVPARFRWDAEQLHDYVLFMANTGLRPDEANNLLHRDIEIVHDGGTNETILVIEVRGKRGVGFCKSTTNAVRPYRRLLNRPKPKSLCSTNEGELSRPRPDDPVFRGNHIRMFNTTLRLCGLRRDREGKARTSYSLRHTYICFRLMEGADIYQIAKNCRTSVEMIEKHYAAHIKTMLDASSINVRKSHLKPLQNPTPGQSPTISRDELKKLLMESVRETLGNQDSSI